MFYIFAPMSYADSPKYNREQTEKNKEVIRGLKNTFLGLIYPNNNYMVYFLEYFPDSNDITLKRKIRNVWNGLTYDEGVKDMIQKIITKIENKNAN